MFIPELVSTAKYLLQKSQWNHFSIRKCPSIISETLQNARLTSSVSYICQKEIWGGRCSWFVRQIDIYEIEYFNFCFWKYSCGLCNTVLYSRWQDNLKCKMSKESILSYLRLLFFFPPQIYFQFGGKVDFEASKSSLQ